MLISQFPDNLLKAWDSCAVFLAESHFRVGNHRMAEATLGLDPPPDEAL
jgi:hypothetical protein